MPFHSTPFLSPGRPAGLVIAASTVLEIAFVAHHPMASGQDGAQILLSIDQLRGMDHLVHGALIAIIIGLMVGFSAFVDDPGRGRPALQAGLLVYLTGCLATIGAAMIDGFITPDIARHFLAKPISEQAVALDLLVFSGLCIQSITRLGLVLMSLGILLWSLVLLSSARKQRWAGLIGLMAGGGATAFLLLSGLELRRPELLAILAAQSLWNAAIAWTLIRGPHRSPGK